MIFADTHSHLYLNDFDDDRYKVIEEAVNRGIRYIILPNIDSTTIEKMRTVASEYSRWLYRLIGLHPTSIKEDYKKELDIIEEELNKNSNEYYGIGEIGIDLYWDKTYLKEQKEAFLYQLKFAEQYNFPVSIHTRNSFETVIDIIKKAKLNINGVFHCFQSTIDGAKQAIDLGFMIGVGGTITYKNSKVVEVVENIDLEHILLETDAPYLSPVPYRGKRNEEKYLIVIAEKIAAIKNCSIEEVAKITTQNMLGLFTKINKSSANE